MKKPKIDVVITGGTIDSEWDSSKDTAITRKETIIPKYFNRLKPDIDLSFNVVCMKDSRQLTPEDLKQIYQAVENSGSDKVLITHGTYTMPDTARYIKAHLKSKKSVVLTGATIPLEGFSLSDAPFNLGFAIATLMTMEPGILLAMNGNLFTPQEVAKNLSEARFFSLEQ